MKAKNCDRCGWPLEAASVRGGMRRHPGCKPAADSGDAMLPLPDEKTAKEPA